MVNYRRQVRGRGGTGVRSEKSAENIAHKRATSVRRRCRVRIDQSDRRPPFFAPWANFDFSLFVALFDFTFTEIAFTYAPWTKIKQISKCLVALEKGVPTSLNDREIKTSSPPRVSATSLMIALIPFALSDLALVRSNYDPSLSPSQRRIKIRTRNISMTRDFFFELISTTVDYKKKENTFECPRMSYE